ncbi:MAG: hypothetical protein HRT35_21920 [Algicola sp.]|nr:hypothetical protein [Algicola sp.]
MFLGTASSNNLHKDSHYDQVESKIESAIGASRAALKNKDIVDWYIHYKVTPLFGVIPDYMKKRVSNTKKLDTKEKKDDAIDWLKEATPAKYKTQWSHYLLLDSKTGASSSYTEPDKTLSAEIR